MLSMRKTAGIGAGLVVFAIVANLAFWGALIYFAFWCLKHFGVIG